jgi:hypothetical protein
MKGSLKKAVIMKSLIALFVLTLLTSGANATDRIVQCVARKPGYETLGQLRTHIRCIDESGARWVNVWVDSKSQSLIENVQDIAMTLYLEKATIPSYWAPTGFTNVAYLMFGHQNASLYIGKVELTSDELKKHPQATAEIKRTFETGTKEKYGKTLKLQKTFEIILGGFYTSDRLLVFQSRNSVTSSSLADVMADPKNLTNNISLPWD